MKRFLSYLLEQLNYGSLQHVLSGEMRDGSGTEHAYHTLIPSRNTKSGTTNLWVAKVSSSDKKTHEFHFGVRDNISPEQLRERHAKISAEERKHVAPHEALYSYAGPGTESTEEDWNELRHHGPETMLHVAHHFTNMFHEIPSGHRVILDPGGTTEDMPAEQVNARQKKFRVYQTMAERSVVKKGLGRIVSSPKDSHIMIERL